MKNKQDASSAVSRDEQLAKLNQVPPSTGRPPPAQRPGCALSEAQRTAAADARLPVATPARRFSPLSSASGSSQTSSSASRRVLRVPLPPPPPSARPLPFHALAAPPWGALLPLLLPPRRPFF